MRQKCILPAILASIVSLLGFSPAAQALCALPYQLTNGQTADATQVMSNFAAVVTCLQNVGPVGPTNALQVNGGGGAFSAIGPLSNGQLAIGANGQPPQAATITAGPGITVTNGSGSITIGSTGGSAGTGLFAQTLSPLPTVSSTGLANTLGTGVSTVDSAVGVYISGPIAGIGAYTNAVPIAPYTITVLLALNQLNGGVISLGWTDGTRMQFVYPDPSGKITVQSNSDIATYAANNYTSAAQGFSHSLLWLRIADDGTNVSFMSSQDGYHFGTAYSVAKASGYLGSGGYSHIFVGSPGGANGMDVTVMSWKQG